MSADPLDRTVLALAGAAGILIFAGGAGWALAGDAIFLSQLMAGIAGCFCSHDGAGPP